MFRQAGMTKATAGEVPASGAKESVLGYVPLVASGGAGENQEEGTFNGIIASSFTKLEKAISERRALGGKSIDSEAGLVEMSVVEGLEKDVRNAAEIMLGEESITRPVKSLWEVDNYHGTHSVDVAVASLLLAAGSGFYNGRQDGLVCVGIAAMLHDIGKERYPELYTRQGEFTEEDHKLMKEHPIDSVNLVKDALMALPDYMRYVVKRGIEEHHENWDGTGYPDGIKGSRISRAAQIIRIADSMESATSPVRAAMYNGKAKSRDEIMHDIAGKSGTMYSPHLVSVLRNGFDEFRLDKMRYSGGRSQGGTSEAEKEYHA